MIATGTRLVVPDWLRRLSGRVWSSRRGRVAVIGVVVWHLAGAIGIVLAPIASADPSSGGTAHPEGSLSSLMGWMNIKDSHGINVADYYLSIDQGGATHPLRAAFAWLTMLEFSAYRILVGGAIWVIHQVLMFKWLQFIVSPVSQLGDALSVLTGRINLVPLAFALAGLAMALWIFRGRYAAAAYEALMALVIAAAAVGFLAHPISTIAGDHGLIVKTKDAALQLSAGLANKGNTSGDPSENVDKLTASLTDTFLRKPTQLVNFGAVLDDRPDNGACARAFDKAYLHPPGKSTTDKLLDGAKDAVSDIPLVGGAASAVLPDSDPTKAVRNEVGKCPGGGDLKSYADAPGVESTIIAAQLIPAAGLILAFAIVLAGRVLLAAAWALFNGLKLIPITPAAISPAFRGTLMRGLADVAMALCQMAFAVIYIAGYSVMINAIFDGDKQVFMKTVFVVDITLIIALLMFWKGMGRLSKLSDRLAEIMASRPGSAPVSIARRTPTSAADVMARARMARGAVNAGVKGVQGATSTGAKLGSTAMKVGRVAATAAATGGTSVVGTAAAEMGRAASAAHMAKFTGAAVSAVASAAKGGANDDASTYDVDSREEQSPVQRAAQAAILRKALDRVAPPAPDSAQHAPIRPGGATPPTARRYTATDAQEPASGARTTPEQVYDRWNRIDPRVSTRTATAPTPPSTTRAPAQPVTDRAPATPQPRAAATPADPVTPRAAQRSSTAPAPATVGATRIR